MKRIFFIAAMVLSSAAGVAQNVPYSRVYSVADKSALDIYFLAKDFAGEKHLDYMRDPVNNEVVMPIQIPFTDDACIKAPGLNGRLTIQAKDGKTRILMDSITYSSPENADARPVFIKTSFAVVDTTSDTGACLPPSGPISALSSCPACQPTSERVHNTLDMYFDNLANDYKSYLTHEIKASRSLFESE